MKNEGPQILLLSKLWILSSLKQSLSTQTDLFPFDMQLEGLDDVISYHTPLLLLPTIALSILDSLVSEWEYREIHQTKSENP